MEVDAVVNAANNTLLGGGGVDGAIHRAAGRELLAECRTLGGCLTGQAKITKGYKLPAKFIIHTVGPIWNGGNSGEEKLLASAYRSSLELAKEYDCSSVAFPLISAGIYGFPKRKAIDIAEQTIKRFLAENDMLVYLVIFDRDSFDIGSKLFDNIKSYIDDNYTQSIAERNGRNPGILSAPSCYRHKSYNRGTAACRPSVLPDDVSDGSSFMPGNASADINRLLNKIDESFSQMLIRKIDEKGMKDSECYHKANIDRKLFSKIKNDPHYRPGKTTVIAFIIALELPLDEAEDMLMKAGFALSHSNKFDIIIEYFIKNGIYDIFIINDTLFEFDQVLLGA